MEGVAAIAIVFVLFTVMAQAATALIAHRTALGAVASAATRLAIDPGSSALIDTLGADLEAIVPGADDVEVHVEIGSRLVTVSAEFRFVPPGPVFRDVLMEVRADAPLVVEP